MVATVTTEPSLLRHYDDGAGWPNATVEKEQAFRKGFLEEARRVAREWVNPPKEGPATNRLTVRPLGQVMDETPFDPDREIEVARRLRARISERFSVYRRGSAGRRTYHLGWRPGHVIPSARARGRHHALEYVVEPWRDLDTADLDVFAPEILSPWLAAVEAWARSPMRPAAPAPPPRLDDVEEVKRHLETMEACLSLGNFPSEPPPMYSQSCPPPPRQLRLTRADQIETRPPDWLLRGMLERDTFALVFGDPGSGKSFLAIDWACRVATGTPWRGHDVKSGPVLYVAGEGRQGLGRRVRAWQERNGVSMCGAPLFIAPALGMSDGTQVVELVKAAEAVSPAKQPSLVVLDTLARCFGGGDENSTQDMSKFVTACDAIRQRWGCTILVVHHTGHADKSRARGAIALKAALDAEYRLTNNGSLLLTATKMKDAETPPPVAMDLVTVDLPGLVDEYGNPVTSAAIEVLDADTGAIVSKAMATRSGKRGKWQEVGLAVARRLTARSEDGQVAIDAWRDECGAAGMVRQNQHRVLDALAKRGQIIVTGEALGLPTSWPSRASRNVRPLRGAKRDVTVPG
jgi:AAA domain